MLVVKKTMASDVLRGDSLHMNGDMQTLYKVYYKQ